MQQNISSSNLVKITTSTHAVSLSGLTSTTNAANLIRATPVIPTSSVQIPAAVRTTQYGLTYVTNTSNSGNATVATTTSATVRPPINTNFGIQTHYTIHSSGGASGILGHATPGPGSRIITIPKETLAAAVSASSVGGSNTIVYDPQHQQATSSQPQSIMYTTTTKSGIISLPTQTVNLTKISIPSTSQQQQQQHTLIAYTSTTLPASTTISSYSPQFSTSANLIKTPLVAPASSTTGSATGGGPASGNILTTIKAITTAPATAAVTATPTTTTQLVQKQQLQQQVTSSFIKTPVVPQRVESPLPSPGRGSVSSSLGHGGGTAAAIEANSDSNGSTTVSANSSPDVEQQQQKQQTNNKNTLSVRLGTTTTTTSIASISTAGVTTSAATTATHFNPIKDLYGKQGPGGIPGSSASAKTELVASAGSKVVTSIASVSQKAPTTQTQGSEQTDGGTTSANDSKPQSDKENSQPGGQAQESTTTTTTDTTATTKSQTQQQEQPPNVVIKKRRNCNLIDSYKQYWKTTNNHFQRYSDIKLPREDERERVLINHVNDMANSPNVNGLIKGWKIYHLKSTMEDLEHTEAKGLDKLLEKLKQMETEMDTLDGEMVEMKTGIERVNELLKGNIQRSKIVCESLHEAQTQLLKIFEHRQHVGNIINRCASKRNSKKREKF